MTAIQAELLAHLPFKRKQTTGGWLSFDAPCCVHNGESPDTRQRGGVIVQGTGGFTYHCFNCGFKTGWQPGRQLSQKTKKFFGWINIPKSKIDELSLEALKVLDSDGVEIHRPIEFTEKHLPEGSIPLIEAIELYPDAINAVEYLYDRGFDIDDYDWYYCPTSGYKDRLIIPFYHNKMLVGFTGRKFTEGKPKYLTEAQSGYVFNVDRQNYKKKFVLVTEGQFDAIAIGGVGIMTNLPNDQQLQIIKSLNKQVIVVPDRDYPGMQLARTAINEGWMVSIPPWESDVKDCADAIKKYGKLFTLKSILDYATDSRIKIELFIKKYPKVKDE